MNEASHTHLIETEFARKEAVWCQAWSSHVVSQDGFAVRTCSKAPVKSLLLGFYGHDLSLTLADLGGEGECVLHAVPDMAGNFDTVSAWPRHERNLMTPYFAANRCDGVTECQECFWIPGGGSRLELS